MKQLRKLEKIVKKILKEKPVARGDDDLLYLDVLDEMKVNISDFTAESFLLNYRKMGIPTIETVGRCRRKVQAKDNSLKPTPEIGLKRKQMENSFYDYSLGI